MKQTDSGSNIEQLLKTLADVSTKYGSGDGGDLTPESEKRQRHVNDFVRSQDKRDHGHVGYYSERDKHEEALDTQQRDDVSTDGIPSEADMEELLGQCKVKEKRRRLRKGRLRREKKNQMDQTSSNQLSEEEVVTAVKPSQTGSTNFAGSDRRAKETTDIPEYDGVGDKDDQSDVQSAFKTLLINFGGRSKMDYLLKHETMFPSAFFERCWLKKHRDKFKVIEKNGSIENVSVYSRFARLCVHFRGMHRCFRKDCDYFHVCCDFITDSCKSQRQKCSLSHNFFDEHNSSLVDKLHVEGLKNKHIAKLFRCSVPEVCRDYNQDLAHDQKTCPYLHVCEQFPCSRGSSCQREHTCYSSKHNISILNMFQIGHLKEDIIARMVLGRNVHVQPGCNPASYSNPGCSPHLRTFEVSEETQKQEDPSFKDNSVYADEELDENMAFRTLVSAFGGRAKMKDLLKNKTRFPSSFFDTDWLKRHKRKFAIFEKDGVIEYVSVYHQKARLCLQCNSSDGCPDRKCSYLHVCSGFVTETCKPHIHKCPLSHNFLESRNAALVSKLGLNEFKNKEIGKIVRCSVPEVCKEYNQCVPHDEDSCLYLHVCDQYPCSQRSTCQLEHRCLSSQHNLWVLNCLRIGHFKESVLNKITLGRNKVLMDNSTNRPVDDDNDDVNAEYAFKTLLTKYEGRERLNHLLKHKTSFPNSFFKDSWLLTHKDKFAIFKNGEKIECISVYCRQAKVCAYFNTPQGCSNKECQYFHVCSAFVTRQCPINDGSCFLSHNFFDDRNAVLVERKQLQEFSHIELVKLVRCSSPEVCQEYNNAESHDEETCTYLHVCDEFPCRKGASCNLEHTYLSSAHNMRILTCFNVSHFQESNLSRLILGRKSSLDQFQTTELTKKGNVPAPRIQERSTQKCVTSGVAPTHAPIADDQFLCEEHIWDTCHNSTKCPHYHGYKRLTYQWQIQLNDTWHDFSESANDRTEQLFCDLESTTGSISINDFMYADIDLILMTAQVYMDPHGTEISVRVRRLSTMSYSEGKRNLSRLTCWHWYWRDDNHVWVMYETPQMQYTLERKYMSGQTEYFFSRGKFHYKLTYRQNKKMSQQNLLTGRKRRVVRRPIYVTRQHIQNKQILTVPGLLQQPPLVMCSVPKHWAPLDLVQPFELVNLDTESPTYIDVKRNFHFTMAESKYTITSIFRVQNPTMWDRHCSHQRSMEHTAQTEGRTERVVERMLFHGTDTEEGVRGICVNGFDPRVCGKNATAYGKGAYFATMATYSNKFTSRRQQKRIMFRARVLVGEFTKGHAHLKRPPSRQDHLLYDSCVDNVDTPALFVIFDIDKAYPEFLIEYEKKTSTIESTSNSSSKSSASRTKQTIGKKIQHNLRAAPSGAPQYIGTQPDASPQSNEVLQATTVMPQPSPSPNTVYPSIESSTDVSQTQSLHSDTSVAAFDNIMRATHTNGTAVSHNVGSMSSFPDVNTSWRPVSSVSQPITTKSPRPTTNAPAGTTNISPASRSPTITPDSRPPTITPDSRPPTITLDSRSPTITPDSRSPTITPVSRSPTISSVSRSTTISSVSRSTTITPVSRSPTITPVSRSPTISSVSRSTTITPVSRSPTITPVSRSPTIGSGQRPTTSPNRRVTTNQSQYSTTLHSSRSPGDDEKEGFEEEESMSNVTVHSTEPKSSCRMM